MIKDTHIILGIDPGTKVTGYGILKVQNTLYQALDFGCIRPPNNLELSKRYYIIFDSIEKLIQKYKPTAIAVETQFVNKNIQSVMKLGMARGCAILAAEKNSTPIFEYAPRSAKLSVVGKGSASKEQVAKMLKMLLNLQVDKIPEDAADALSLAICHANKINFSNKLRISKDV